jgi:hypothetical protein
MDHLVHICFNCKAQVVDFYNFKVKVKPNLNDLDEEKTKIVEQVQEFLKEQSESMVVIRETENTLTILPTAMYVDGSNMQEIKVEEVKYPEGDFSGSDRKTAPTQTLTNFKALRVEIQNNAALGNLKRKHDGSSSVYFELRNAK